MKRNALHLASALCALVIMAGNARAQGGPPGCCYQPGTGSGGESGGSAGGAITISGRLLGTLGVTRAGMLDRLSETLFPGRSSEIVLGRTQAVIPRFYASGAAPTGNLVAVYEKKYYQVARDRVSAEDIDAADDLYLTDGVTSVRVVFGQDEPAAAR